MQSQLQYRKDVECARYKFTGRNFYAKTPGRTIEVYRMRICLSEHFTYGKLFRFVLPSVVMMIFTSVYGVVDGLFVSNFVGKTSFAAVNLIMPFPMGLGAVGFMLGTGGSALVAKTLGEGNRERANKYFSMLIYASATIGVVFSVAGIAAVRPVAKAMGAGFRHDRRLRIVRQYPDRF